MHGGVIFVDITFVPLSLRILQFSADPVDEFSAFSDLDHDSHAPNDRDIIVHENSSPPSFSPWFPCVRFDVVLVPEVGGSFQWDPSWQNVAHRNIRGDAESSGEPLP